MDYQLIATWLGLPPGPWPPDHYTLLGLPPGDTNAARIEQRVHERLMRVRSYQLSFPELATEAMKRIAQAFDCLTTPQNKKAYDAVRFPAAPLAASPRVPTTLAHDTVQTKPVSATPPAPTSSAAPVQTPAPHDAPAWWAHEQLSWKTDAVPPPVRQPDDSAVKPPPMRVQPESSDAPPPAALPVAEPNAPPPVRALVAVVAPPTPPTLVPDPPVNGSHAPPPAPMRPTRVPKAKPVDPIFEAARSSPGLREKLGTRRGVYQRLVWLRQVLAAWENVGKHVGRLKKRLTRTGEEAELARQLEAIEELLQEQASLLGQPGQPGYRVLALAQLESLATGFPSLDEQQRDLLARDWSAGRTLLRAHGRFLREQAKRLRYLTLCQRMRRTIDAALTEYRGTVLLVLALLGLLVLVAAWFW
jgi:hypothetical protein